MLNQHLTLINIGRVILAYLLYYTFTPACGDLSPYKHAKSTQMYLENDSSASSCTSFDDSVLRKNAITWSLVNRLWDDAILLKYTKNIQGYTKIRTGLSQLQ